MDCRIKHNSENPSRFRASTCVLWLRVSSAITAMASPMVAVMSPLMNSATSNLYADHMIGCLHRSLRRLAVSFYPTYVAELNRAYAGSYLPYDAPISRLYDSAQSRKTVCRLGRADLHLRVLRTLCGLLDARCSVSLGPT